MKILCSVQLDIALSFYQQALSYMPGKKTIMTRYVRGEPRSDVLERHLTASLQRPTRRIHDIQQAITLGLPVPPRKGVPKADALLPDQPVAGPSRPPSALGGLIVDVSRAKTLPRSSKASSGTAKTAAQTKKAGSALNIFADPTFVRPKDVDAIDIIPLPTPPSNPPGAVAKSKAKPARKAAAAVRRPPTPARTSEDEEADVETAAEVVRPEPIKRQRATRAATTTRRTRSIYKEAADSSDDDDDDDLGGLSDDDEWVPT